ncbi:hypothetical protein F4824DRAFT_464585 [Ustulina deusta]|nr:hypothetical protein F4824DRAFT_464585 [Ustulina deusta]
MVAQNAPKRSAFYLLILANLCNIAPRISSGSRPVRLDYSATWTLLMVCFVMLPGPLLIACLESLKANKTPRYRTPGFSFWHLDPHSFDITRPDLLQEL